MGFVFVYESLRLAHVDLLLKWGIEKSRFYIELVNFKVHGSGERQ